MAQGDESDEVTPLHDVAIQIGVAGDQVATDVIIGDQTIRIFKTPRQTASLILQYQAALRLAETAERS